MFVWKILQPNQMWVKLLIVAHTILINTKIILLIKTCGSKQKTQKIIINWKDCHGNNLIHWLQRILVFIADGYGLCCTCNTLCRMHDINPFPTISLQPVMMPVQWHTMLTFWLISLKAYTCLGRLSIARIADYSWHLIMNFPLNMIKLI